MAHTRAVLLESLGVSVEDFRCQAEVHPEGPEEQNPAHSIVFVRRGVFGRRRLRGALVVSDANHVLFFNADEAYRYSHPLPGGDECTILSVPTSLALEVVGRHAPRDAERPEAPFPVSHGLSSPRTARLHYELLAALNRGSALLDLEDGLAELVDEAVRAAYQTPGARATEQAVTLPAARRRRELAEAAKLVLNERLASPPSLGDLARMLGCSSFHLSRTFRTEMGLSLRRYVGRLRLRSAGRRLSEGASDLTALALDLGYADHSHLTNSFRREWGVTPSAFRSLARR